MKTSKMIVKVNRRNIKAIVNNIHVAMAHIIMPQFNKFLYRCKSKFSLLVYN